MDSKRRKEDRFAARKMWHAATMPMLLRCPYYEVNTKKLHIASVQPGPVDSDILYGRSVLKPGALISATARDHSRRVTSLELKSIHSLRAGSSRHILEHFVTINYVAGSVVLALRGLHTMKASFISSAAVQS